MGGIFIVLILLLALSVLFNLFLAYSSFQSGVLERSREDVRRQRTDVRVVEVFFGSMASANRSRSATAAANTVITQIYPVGNMNFTRDAEGWFFTRALEEPCDLLICTTVGGWTAELPSVIKGGAEIVFSAKSGPGLIFDLFSIARDEPRVRGPRDDVRVQMNWTTSFDLDGETINRISDVRLSWTYLAPEGKLVPDRLKSCSLSVVLVRPDKRNFVVDRVPQPGDKCDDLVKDKFDFRGVAVDRTIFNQAGRYHLVLFFQLVADLKTRDKLGSIQIYMDDVGLSITLTPSTTWVADFDLTVPTGVTDPLTLQRIIFQVTSRANASVYHWIYIRDFSINQWILVGGTPGRVEEFTTQLDIGSPQARNFVDSSGNAKVRVHAVGFQPFTLTLTASTTGFIRDKTRVALFIENRGSTIVHLVSLYISGGGVFAHFDVDPTAPGVSGRFDLWLDPGERVVLPVAFTWTPGTMYTITVTTENGVVSTGVFRAV